MYIEAGLHYMNAHLGKSHSCILNEDRDRTSLVICSQYLQATAQIDKVRAHCVHTMQNLRMQAYYTLTSITNVQKDTTFIFMCQKGLADKNAGVSLVRLYSDKLSEFSTWS